MLRQLFKHYIPFSVLIFLVLFIWLKEVLLGEGYSDNYFHLPEHQSLVLFLKGMGKIIILGAGFYGLSTLALKWVKMVWLYWYMVAFVIEALSIMVNTITEFKGYGNFLDFLNSAYYINTTPFPYLFLWLLGVVARRLQLSKKTNQGIL